jgi:hypothetical protein
VNLEDFKKDFNQEAAKLLAFFDFNKDSDNDGILDLKDDKPKDFNNFTKEKQNELFSPDYNFSDKLRTFFGLSPKDSDKDGLPDSYELKRKMNANNTDSDNDGMYDGEEIIKGFNPNNADQDKDGVLDGRDAYPKDIYKSVEESDTDTDGDKIGDRLEVYLKTNPFVKDSDNDGLSDSADEEPLVNYKLSKNIKNINSDNDLSFGIQNNFISFFADILYVLIFLAFIFFIYVFRKWFTQINHDIEHYYHMFHNSYGFKHDEHNQTIHHENFKSIKAEVKNNNQQNHSDKKREINHSDNKEEKDKSLTFTSILSNGLERWEIISKYMSDDMPDMWKLGIIEADDLLDNALKNAGYLGNGLGDRLKSANFKTIDLAWEAHKIRNRIAHAGINFSLTEREARKAFVMYEAVFKDLKVI